MEYGKLGSHAEIKDRKEIANGEVRTGIVKRVRKIKLKGKAAAVVQRKGNDLVLMMTERTLKV